MVVSRLERVWEVGGGQMFMCCSLVISGVITEQGDQVNRFEFQCHHWLLLTWRGRGRREEVEVW